MKTLISFFSPILFIIIFCAPLDGEVNTVERDLTVQIMSDIGVGLGTGTFNIKKTDAFLTVSQSTISLYGGTTPDAMGMLFNNLRTMNPYGKDGEIRPNLFQFPLAVGSTWEWDEISAHVEIECIRKI